MATASLSRIILIALLVMFVVSLLPFAGAVFGPLLLTPDSIVPRFQLWRILTHPLAVAGGIPLSLFFAAITFSAPAEEVEQMLGRRTFGVLLGVMLLCASIVHVIAFGGTAIPLMGPGNLAFFALTGFVYVFPHSQVRLIFFGVRSWVLLATMVVILASITLYYWINGIAPYYFFSDGGMGLLLAALYFHLRYQKFPILLGPIARVERMMESRRGGGAWRATPAARKAAAPQPARLRMPFQKSQSREMSDEERLNNILERISAKGYSDLSADEQAFLRDYSGRL